MRSFFVFLGLLLVSAFAVAQAADSCALKPPKGATTALVVWEDMQCPVCSQAYPQLIDAGKTYKIPVVLHDFPLTQHDWSRRAHILARYFDDIATSGKSKNKNLGNDFRSYIYTNQPGITAGNVDEFARKFAQQNNVQLPFSIDPAGALERKVNADASCGRAHGVNHTPTIYIVSTKNPQKPYVELDPRDLSKLFETIESMMPTRAAKAKH